MRVLRAVLVIVTIAAGCNTGPAPPKRGKLSGKITLDGQPVAAANIRFIALEADGINVLAKVTNGEYSLPEGEGPVKGKYRVEFSVPSATKYRMPNPDDPGKWIEEPKEVLPPRYHRESSVTLDYDPASPQPFNYALTSH